jgi:uncharacterized protein (DUF2267 family)
MHAEDFWDAVRDRWTPGSEEELRSVTHHVLLHLRRALPGDEAQVVFGVLPAELVSIGLADVRPDGLDTPAIYGHVGREAHVPADMAAEATDAVFAVVRGLLPPSLASRVERHLPRGLGQAWRAAA